MNHEHYMKIALEKASVMAGQTWPNPFVGAALVRDGQLLGVAATAKNGRPHAETQLLEAAGSQAKGASLYVTLEPCAHQGETPPCTQAIMDAGVKQVIIACEDPDPRVSGIGIKQLHDAGIEVITDICAEEARWQHRGFFSKVNKNRPWITLKMAASLDGKAALGNGESKWISGDASREYAHRLRAEYDAILSTSRSVSNDDARLTCRLPGLEHRTPVRVVIDRNLRLSQDKKIFAEDQSLIWLITYKKTEDTDFPEHVQLITLERSGNWLEEIFSELARRGITRVLVETGGTFASALLGSDLVDELQWFTAPIIIGEEGVSAVRALNIESLVDTRIWQRRETKIFEGDVLHILARKREA